MLTRSEYTVLRKCIRVYEGEMLGRDREARANIRAAYAALRRLSPYRKPKHGGLTTCDMK